MRQSPSQPPRKTPNRLIASRVYSEQLGTKRQLGGSHGEIRY